MLLLRGNHSSLIRTHIITSIIALILISIGGFFGYSQYQSLQDDISRSQIERDSIHTSLQSSETDRTRLLSELSGALDRVAYYQDVLSDSGTLYYIGLDTEHPLGYREIQVSSYDTIRWVNHTSTRQTVRLYDHSDLTGEALATISIPPSEVSVFHLKQSGKLYYTTDLGSGALVIGTAIVERNPRTFVDTEIFPLLRANDPDSIHPAFAHFREVINIDSTVSAECHDFSHIIGHRAFELYGFSAAISRAEDDICAGGYTHGILEAYFRSFPELKNNPEKACETLPDNKKGSCFHGVGHGLMFISKNNISESLVGCRTLPTSVYQNRCAEGVYMELYSGDPEHAGGVVGYNTGALFEPCTQYGSGSERYVCGFYAGLGYLRYTPDDYVGALTACRTGGAYSHMCIRGVGREIAKRHVGDALKLERICSGLSDTTSITNCLEGGINYTRLQFEPKPEQIKKYCLGFQTHQSLCMGEKGDTEETDSK